MKIKALVVASLLGGLAGPAFGATIEVDPAVGVPYDLISQGGCTNSVLTPAAAKCFGVVTSPNNNLGNGADEVADFLAGEWNISGVTGGVGDNPVDADLNAAGWQLDLGSLVSGPFAIALKQANGFSLYYFDLGTATQFVTFTDNDGFGGTGNLDISHWTLYGGNTPVPEPATLALLGLGLAGLGLVRRRK